jgi:hypothetical protein
VPLNGSGRSTAKRSSNTPSGLREINAVFAVVGFGLVVVPLKAARLSVHDYTDYQYITQEARTRSHDPVIL